MKKTKHSLSVDQLVKFILQIIALAASSVIVVIIVFITARGIMPFVTNNDSLGSVNLWRFLTGRTWLEGPTFVSNLYGAGYLVINTLYVVFLSLLISFPISVLSALFIAKICPKHIAVVLRTIVELLASIPSIIFGLVGAGFVLPIVYTLAEIFGIRSVGGLGVISVAIVLALMSIPTITTISETAIRSVDKKLENASFALGATKAQTHSKITLIASKNGIFSGAILAIGRALGEATAVSLVAGNATTGPSFSFFETTSTLTSMMLMGMHETSGLDYDIRFSLGALLLVIILIVNFFLNVVKKKIGDLDE